MNTNAPDGPRQSGLVIGLERLTAGVLVLVIGVLGWMALAALNQWTATAGQVAVVVVILLVSLVLVSVLALMQTR